MRIFAVLGLLALTLTGCSARHAHVTTTVTTIYSTVYKTRPPSPTTEAPAAFKPKPAVAVTPAVDLQTAPAGEKIADCPYVVTRAAWDLEGNRMGLTTTYGTRPVSCRFYFLYDDHHANLEIAPRVFASNVLAHNAMVLTAQTGTNVAAIPGVDGAVYQTHFYAADGATDWAAVFVKGHTLVVVRTDQTDTSQDAVAVVNAIIGKF